MTRVAAVDIGTNSTRLLVADIDAGRIEDVERETRVTRLGEGVDERRRLLPVPVARVRNVLTDFRRQLESLQKVAGTLALYESPFRIEKLLGELNAVFPERTVVLARELTKKFEEFVRGTPAELLVLAARKPMKGEFVVLIAPAPRAESPGGLS